MLQFFSGLLLGGAAVAVAQAYLDEPAKVYTLPSPDRVTLCHLQSRASAAERAVLAVQADVSGLLLTTLRQREEIYRLRLELDAARRGGAWPLHPAPAPADEPERIPPQNLPTRPHGR